MMVKKMIQGLIYGIIAFLIILLTNNFSLHLTDGNITIGSMMYEIYLPKFLFSIFLGWTIANLGDLKNKKGYWVSVSLAIIIVLGTQTLDILYFHHSFSNLLTQSNPGQTDFPFTLIYLLVLLIVLLPVLFAYKGIVMGLVCFGSIFIIHFILDASVFESHINPKFWIGIELFTFYLTLGVTASLYPIFKEKGLFL